MIVKDEFLERRRVELAIGAKFKRHLCHPIGLTGGVDSKSVRFTLGDAHAVLRSGVARKSNVLKIRPAAGVRLDRQCRARPIFAPASDGCIKQDSSECESDEYENSEVGQQLRAVI
jgi:hypothetical protein